MKGLERRQIKKSLSLPLLHLTSSIFSSVCLTFACVVCCAALVLLLCVALTSNDPGKVPRKAMTPEKSPEK